MDGQQFWRSRSRNSTIILEYLAEYCSSVYIELCYVLFRTFTFGVTKLKRIKDIFFKEIEIKEVWPQWIVVHEVWREECHHIFVSYKLCNCILWRCKLTVLSDCEGTFQRYYGLPAIVCDTVVQKLVAFSNQPKTWTNMKPILNFIFYISFSLALIRPG